MKQKTNKYKVKLENGTTYLNRGEMEIILALSETNFLLGLSSLVFPPRGYKKISDEELIQAIQREFNCPIGIKKLLNWQKDRLNDIYSLLKKKDKRMVELIKNEWRKTEPNQY